MQCQSCAFFHAEQTQCRRYAPQPQVEANAPIAIWPTVSTSDWCGEYKASDTARAA